MRQHNRQHISDGVAPSLQASPHVIVVDRTPDVVGLRVTGELVVVSYPWDRRCGYEDGPVIVLGTASGGIPWRELGDFNRKAAQRNVHLWMH